MFRHHDRALYTDKCPQGNQHRALNLLRQTSKRTFPLAPEVERKPLRVEKYQRYDDKKQQRRNFCHRADKVDNRRLLDAFQNQRVKTPYQQRTADNGINAVAARKIRRKEIIKRIHRNHGITDVAANLAQPVRPPDGKADIRAETCPAVHINARRQIRFDDRQNAKRIRQKINTDAGNQPGQQHRADRRARGHILRQAVNAAADH